MARRELDVLVKVLSAQWRGGGIVSDQLHVAMRTNFLKFVALRLNLLTQKVAENKFSR